ncbi:hypothetical protein C8R47DRAFT_1148739 [Mycena vitilis]|nr:hypothetical protein C8R47DRAFT_1148739 [Mycena vitilis]
MCRVFVSTHDLEIHHAAFQNLPPLPQLDRGSSEAPRRSPTPIDHSSGYPWTPPNSQPEHSQPVFDITSCNAYLAMLSQPPPDTEPAVADTAIVAQDGLYNAAVRDILQYNEESPLFKFDDDVFLTSPIMEPPLTCFGTSSTDTPFSDFISTPEFNDDALFPPLLGERDGSSSRLSLFGGHDVSLPDIPPKLGSGLDVIDGSPPDFEHFFPTRPSSQKMTGLDPELRRQQRQETSYKRTISNTSTRESSPSRSIKRRRMDIESLLGRSC